MYWSTGNHLLAAYYSQGLDRDDKTYIDMVNNEGKLMKTEWDSSQTGYSYYLITQIIMY